MSDELPDITYFVNGRCGTNIQYLWDANEIIKITELGANKLRIDITSTQYQTNYELNKKEKERFHQKIREEIAVKVDERRIILQRNDDGESQQEDREDLDICNGLIAKWTSELKLTTFEFTETTKTTKQTFEIPENILTELVSEGRLNIWFLWLRNPPKLEPITSVEITQEVKEDDLDL